MDLSFEQTHRRYQAAIDKALENFKDLISSPNSSDWIPIQPNNHNPHSSQSPFGDSKTTQSRQALLNGVGPLDFPKVQVHKRKDEGAVVVRAVCEVAVDPDRVDVDDFRAALQTAEVRGLWDSLVDKATVVEVIDPHTRILKTDFRLGWPANPRDSITISKTINDPNTVIDISTSLPRSDDEPAYLRPSPPFVRSHIHLLAWCIQLIPDHKRATPPDLPPPPDNLDSNAPDLDTLTPRDPDRSLNSFSRSSLNRARVTVFWKINWKGAIFSTQHSQIASLLNSFVEYVRAQASHIPLLSTYGDSLALGSSAYDKAEETFNFRYSILPEESSESARTIELRLSTDHGWDVQVKIEGQNENEDGNLNVLAEKSPESSRTSLRILHSEPAASNQIVRVRVSVQRLAGGKSLRVNDNPVRPTSTQSRTLASSVLPLIEDTHSISNFSLQTGNTDASKLTTDTASTIEMVLKHTNSPNRQLTVPTLKKRNTPTRAHIIAAMLRRSYIYFSSLLQEPDAKWKHVADSRGVSVTQLQSIDPTLTIYRAEATFVGATVWNVYSAITTLGARMYWDKSLSEVILLEDINDLSSLWQIKQKGAWMVAPRDAVLITTTYKSPSSVHVFSVSTDDSNLFPSIQPPSAGFIRTQTEILGWSIESLSPTTTQITLIDQHDPLGWSPKSWTPAQLINQVASVGEFTLKYGGPPIITRVAGARVTMSKYEHEKRIFRAEYSASESALASAMSDPTAGQHDLSEMSLVECELRCDCETWASSLDIVVDPPPTKASCLKRHKLSSGGGWWIMIEHEAGLLRQEKAKVLIRRGTPNPDEKGSVCLNGTNMKVDVEELLEEEAKNLSKQRRVKASLIPLDQYSLSGPRLWRGSPGASNPSTRSPTPVPELSQAVMTAVDQPSSTNVTSSPTSDHSRSSLPMASALEALARLQAFHIEQGPDTMGPPPGWTLVAEKGTSSVYKKVVPQVSGSFPIYRVDRVIEGVTAEEMVATLSAVSIRPLWDDRVDTACFLESYGHGCTTQLLVTKPTFPFKARLLQIGHVHAQVQIPSATGNSSTNTVHFIAGASFRRNPPDDLYDSNKLNPQGLVEGNILLEGWIMETIDPYSSSSHQIPSTRCTYFNAIDYGGSVPVALNSMLNSSLPRVISGIETLVKSHGPLPKLCRPVFGLRINGPLGTDGADDWQWKLKGTDCQITAVSVDATTRSAFHGVFLVPKGANESKYITSSPTAGAVSNGLPNSQSHSRFDGVRQLSAASPVASDGSIYVRRLVSQPDLRRRTSVGQSRRPTPTSASNLHNLHIIDPKSFDLVVAEVALDRKLYPSGCNVTWTANFLKEGADVNLKPAHEIHELITAEPVVLPIEVSVHEMPSPTVFAASLDPAARREHFLTRMTIPVGVINSPIKDPLTSLPDTDKAALPTWYNRLSSRNTVVNVQIEPLRGSEEESEDKGRNDATQLKSPVGVFQVIVKGEPQRIVPLKTSQASLERWETDDYMGSYPSLSRVTQLAKVTSNGQSSFAAPAVVDALPSELERPCGVAVRFTSKVDENIGSSPPPGSVAVTPQLLSPVREENNETETDSKPNHQTNVTSTMSADDSTRRPSGAFAPLSDVLTKYQFQKLPSAVMTSLLKPRTYTTRHLIITALISFLLGSLIRSICLPSDFIIIPTGSNVSESTLLSLLATRQNWREIKKLLELKLLFFNSWSVIIAIVKTNS